MPNRAIMTWILLLSGSAGVAAQPGHHDHLLSPDPIGVMGSHLHPRGQWMFSYRYLHMDMDGNRSGTQRLSPQQVFDSGFMVAPLSMTMEMHSFGLMYGYSDDLTLMFMAHLVRKEMDHQTRTGRRFTTRADGLGDIKVVGLYRLLADGAQELHLNAGLSLPTGSIEERDDTPMLANAILPYPMQLGSGTYDILLGTTYNNRGTDWSTGLQVLAVLRTDHNDRAYRLGHRYTLTGWAVRHLSPSISASVRLNYQHWDDIRGADAALNPRIVPTADPQRRGGQRADLLAGFSYIAQGPLKGNRLSIEVGAPVYQDLDGPQLETDFSAILAWQLAF